MGAESVPTPGAEPLQPIWKRLWRSRFTRIVQKFVILPLVSTLLAGMIIGRVANTFLGPKKYYVYIVGDESQKSISDMMQAANGSFGSLDDVSVQGDIRDDFGDPEEARTIAEELTQNAVFNEH